MGVNNNQNRRIKDKFFILLVTFLFIILCVTAGAGLTFYGFLSSLSENSSGVKPKAANDKNAPVNILIMGVDVGTPGLKSDYDNKRTDTIMLMNYNPKIDEVKLVSIPRDLLVKIKGKNQKINAAHAIGGVSYLIACVEQLLDVDVNYYGKVNYEGFRELIDIIGGVEMKINQRMDYDDPCQNLHIHFKKGEVVHLDGKKAEEFFRWRKNNDGTGLADGDLGRIENQHLFIEKVVDKFKSVAIVPKIPEILKAIPKYAETNMGSEELLRYGAAVARIGKEKFAMTTVRGDAVYIDGVSYIVYDEKKNVELVSVLKTEDNESTKTVLKRSILKVQVLNGTKLNGVAAEFSEKIRNIGYNNVITGNGQKTTVTKVMVYGLDKNTESYIKHDFGLSNITYYEQKKGEYDIVVILGHDYKK